MKKLNLSELPYEVTTFDAEEMIDWMLDNGADTIINNFSIQPFVEYDLSDLEQVWERIISDESIVDYLLNKNQLG